MPMPRSEASLFKITKMDTWMINSHTFSMSLILRPRGKKDPKMGGTQKRGLARRPQKMDKYIFRVDTMDTLYTAMAMSTSLTESTSWTRITLGVRRWSREWVPKPKPKTLEEETPKEDEGRPATRKRDRPLKQQKKGGGGGEAEGSSDAGTTPEKSKIDHLCRRNIPNMRQKRQLDKRFQTQVEVLLGGHAPIDDGTVSSAKILMRHENRWQTW